MGSQQGLNCQKQPLLLNILVQGSSGDLGCVARNAFMQERCSNPVLWHPSQKKSREKSRRGLSVLGWSHKTQPSSGNKQAKRTEGSIAREEEGNGVGKVGDFPLNSAHISQPLSVDAPPDHPPQTRNATAHLFISSSLLCL